MTSERLHFLKPKEIGRKLWLGLTETPSESSLYERKKSNQERDSLRKTDGLVSDYNEELRKFTKKRGVYSYGTLISGNDITTLENEFEVELECLAISRGCEWINSQDRVRFARFVYGSAIRGLQKKWLGADNIAYSDNLLNSARRVLIHGTDRLMMDFNSQSVNKMWLREFSHIMVAGSDIGEYVDLYIDNPPLEEVD